MLACRVEIQFFNFLQLSFSLLNLNNLVWLGILSSKRGGNRVAEQGVEPKVDVEEDVILVDRTKGSYLLVVGNGLRGCCFDE